MKSPKSLFYFSSLFAYCYHGVIVISFSASQSDHIKLLFSKGCEWGSVVEPSFRPEVQDTCQLRKILNAVKLDYYNLLFVINKVGYNKLSCNKVDYNKLGYNKLGDNRLGYNKLGYNKLGYNKLGYNKLGFNKLLLTTNIFITVFGICYLITPALMNIICQSLQDQYNRVQLYSHKQ